MAIKLTSASSGTEGYLGVDANVALVIRANNQVVVNNAIVAAGFEGSLATNIVAVPALNIDCSQGNYFTKTITTGTNTFTVSNVPTTRAYSFTLELTQTGGTFVLWSGVVWPNAFTPTFTAGKTHLLMFFTDDAGTTWRATALNNYSS